MAIDVRGIVDYDNAEFLFDTVSKKGKFNYYINNEAKLKHDGHRKPIKMTKQDELYIDSVMQGIGQMTGLKPKRTTNFNKSTFDISKTEFNSSNGILGYYYPDSWGAYLMFNDAYKEKNLNGLTRETIDHEIGHAIGLSHPYGSGTNSNYTTADTVMSYNSLKYENGEEIYFGYTPSDDNAISYWWGNTNSARAAAFVFDDDPTELGGDVYVETINRHGEDHSEGDHDSHSHGLETFTPTGKKIRFNYDFLLKTIGADERGKPFLLKLSDQDNVIDTRKWTESVAEDIADFSRIGIRAEGGDDKLILSGKNLSSQKGFKLSFSGGEGNDNLVLKNIDGITGSAGLLFGFNKFNTDIPRTITLKSENEQIVKITAGNSTKKIDSTSFITIQEDVEIIKLGTIKYDFDELYTLLKNDSVALVDL
jgi:hypothetical protein